MSSAGNETTGGSCLCGAVKYQVSGSPARRVLCHCTSCKKSSGTMFAANSFYAEPQVVVESSEDSLKTYVNTLSDSGGTISRSFCGNCGSNLFTRTSNFQGVVVVSSGTLDLPLGSQGANEWTPEQEFFCKRRGAWMAGAGAPAEQQYQNMT